MAGAPPVIRTPDQRIRIFVSSTLRELAAERVAARAAIEQMRLAPVMFELGARPHPPRALYRSYLDQSDVFIGIYGSSYGWVAPGEDVSGLEDEYNLAPPGMPKLIYIKAGVDRDERLADLISRIRDDDTVAYVAFDTADDLEARVADDLATLLAERFDASRVRGPAAASSLLAARVPSAYTALIGRDDDVARVAGVLGEPDIRLVTLLGPGGIGKSRLAIAVAAAVAAAVPGTFDDTVFVALEDVLEPELMLTSIGYALDIRDTGGVPLEQRLSVALEGRRLLLVLDNFEQLVTAAPVLVRLFTVAPSVTFLVTSRVVLRIRGERVYEVPALGTHDPAAPESVTRARSSAAAALFAERAAAVKPGFVVTDANAGAVVGICRSLQGLPLAIELAAARVRVLTPAEILRRLDQQLPVLVDGSRDVPARQRTLRSTIEWSTGLLAAPERRMLVDLAVFSQSFSFASIEQFGRRRGWGFDEFEALETLVDSSLVERTDDDGEGAFALFATVREFGVEKLVAGGEEEAARTAHALVYADLARERSAQLTTSGQLAAIAALNLERGNLRAAVRHLIRSGRLDDAADVAWRLYQYWWVGGFIAEVAMLMEELVAAAQHPLDERTRAVADFYIGWRDMWTAPSPSVPVMLHDAADRFAAHADRLGVAMSLSAAGLAEVNTAAPDMAKALSWMREGVAEFHSAGAGWGEALALVALGRILWITGDVDAATAQFHDAVTAATTMPGGEFAATVASHHLARVQLLRGDLDEAERMFAAGLAGSAALRHDEGIAYGLEGLCAIAAARGEVDRAGVLAGAAASIRTRIAIFDAPAFVFHNGYLDSITDAGRLAAAIERGREYGPAEAAQYALAGSAGP